MLFLWRIFMQYSKRDHNFKATLSGFTQFLWELSNISFVILVQLIIPRGLFCFMPFNLKQKPSSNARFNGLSGLYIDRSAKED